MMGQITCQNHPYIYVNFFEPVRPTILNPDGEQGRVSWPSFGPVAPEVAREFATAVLSAADIAEGKGK